MDLITKKSKTKDPKDNDVVTAYNVQTYSNLFKPAKLKVETSIRNRLHDSPFGSSLGLLFAADSVPACRFDDVKPSGFVRVGPEIFLVNYQRRITASGPFPKDASLRARFLEFFLPNSRYGPTSSDLHGAFRV